MSIPICTAADSGPCAFSPDTVSFESVSGHGTPEETNKRWHFLYEHGETGFSAAVDALTFNGIDPDDPRADLEVGTAGVPLYCIDSMYALSKDLPIDKISVALVVEPFSSAPICAMWFNMCLDKGYDLKQIMGTCQNDVKCASLRAKRYLYSNYRVCPLQECGAKSWKLNLKFQRVRPPSSVSMRSYRMVHSTEECSKIPPN